MGTKTLSGGDVVELEYTMTTRTTRQTVEATVKAVMGETVYLESPFDTYKPDTLVVDADDVVWARHESRDDALFGRNAVVEPAD